jgi:transaldolase/glucose-6-phosphate isomerase
MNSLRKLETYGQSPWLDYLTRSLMEKGELAEMITRDGLKGVTSNPSIFQKAIAGSDEYAPAIKEFLSEADHGASEIYEHLAIADIRAAADVLRPVYDQTWGRDGYISLECSPYLANDTAASVTEGLRLWAEVARPNLMIKTPATPAGLPTIRELIGQGVNVNVTLLFSVDVYAQVVEAYLSGLEDFARAGGDLSKIASVASIFVSRIDAAIDKRLEAVDTPEALALRGKAAIANSKLAYATYKRLFSGSRWAALAAAGARTQRLLWASTSTKSPAYKDTLYVDALVGRDTVNTMPPATMDAYRDHGDAAADSVEHQLGSASEILAALKGQGIDLVSITNDLVTEGVQQFADDFDKLLGAVAGERRASLKGALATLEISPGRADMKAAIVGETEAWRKDGRIRRLWSGDKTLWTGEDEDRWGGWLEIVTQELGDLRVLDDFAKDVSQARFTDVVLLGMGGSSLGPEVLGETFGPQSGWPRFHNLDSTDPAQIKAVEDAVDLASTLFIVSSKSGGTLEPNILLDYFFARVVATRGEGAAAGACFVAVTDPGSSLEARAKAQGFSHIFHGLPSIGGRYSVLSKFGLAPAAAMGLDVKRLLDSARVMVRSCGPDVPPSENPGVQLGIALGVAASQFGRDKITIIASPGIEDLGAWLEQLVAESTGKRGRGLIPLAGEPLGPPARYGGDRLFAYLELEGHADAAQREAVEALETAGHPVARIVLPDIWCVSQEFFRWEIATAVASAIIGVNPFDQPDVEASKQKTNALMRDYEEAHAAPKEEPVFRQNGVALYADSRNAEDLGRHNSLVGYLRSHFARVHDGDYVAFLAYLQRDGAHERVLASIREAVRDKTGAATCLGFGPRFQHSTGQAYKGGPNTGVFLQITCDDPLDLDVPGHAYSFGVVKAAQASGDLGVLAERDRRLLRIHLKDVDAGLAELAHATKAALQ